MKSACLIAAEADVLAFIDVDSMQKLACWVSDVQVAEIGLINRARLAFALHWSARRRRHQAAARWHHYSSRLLAAAT